MTSDRDAATTAFSDLLRRLLREGTRPNGVPGILGPRWTLKMFADTIGSPDDTLRKWLSGSRRPRDTTMVERALFGSGLQWEHLRRELRDAHEAARRPKLPVELIKPDGAPWRSVLRQPSVAAFRRRPFITQSALLRMMNRCGSCLANDQRLELHHIVPTAHGGSPDPLKNWQLLCPLCHKIKHSGMRLTG